MEGRLHLHQQVNAISDQLILFRPPVMKESNLAFAFPLGEDVNATTAGWVLWAYWEISGNPGRLPGKTGSSIRFDGTANKKILIRNHRAMRMNNGGQYTANIWLRYEVSSSAWGSVFERKGRNYYLPLVKITPTVVMFIIVTEWVQCQRRYKCLSGIP